jgi:hypothetical protein
MGPPECVWCDGPLSLPQRLASQCFCSGVCESEWIAWDRLLVRLESEGVV